MVFSSSLRVRQFDDLEFRVSDLPTTNLGLLDRLRGSPDDPEAWTEFVDLYSAPVLRWCRSHGLQPADAADVAQDVLVRYWKRSKRFHHDPSLRFRAYLRRMVVGAVSDWHSQRSVKNPGAGLESLHDRLVDLPAREDLADRIEETHDAHLAARAVDAVRARVRPSTWRAFQLQVIEGKRGTDVAKELGLKVNTVYVARHNVTQMLRAVAQSLSSEGRP